MAVGQAFGMKVKDLSELTRPSDGALVFGFMRSLSPDDQARSIQSMVASADLSTDVPEQLAASFERLRSIFAYGLFCYEAFTAVQDLAWLTFEQALRDRFLTFYGNEIPMISTCGEQILPVQNFEEVRDALARGQFRKGGWTVKLRSTGAPLRLDGQFRGSYGQLQQWARQEGLFAGQQNKKTEAIFQDFRNWAAHPHRHLDMPSSAARTIHDLAETINRLWGHQTPGGRLYPAPLEREVKVIGWPNGPSAFTYVEMFPEALGYHRDETDDWSFVIVLTVPGDDSLEDFDTLYDITPRPVDLVWGPGSKSDALVWLESNARPVDTVTYLDRVFAIRTTDSKTYLPQRPCVALGLPEDHRDGSWHLVRADFPLAAFNHVRHRGGVAACGAGDARLGCAVEDLYEGSWDGLGPCLLDLGMAPTPVNPTRVRVPRWHPYPVEVGDD